MQEMTNDQTKTVNYAIIGHPPLVISYIYSTTMRHLFIGRS